MVLLITGSSHTGKTLAAQRVVEQYAYFCLSIDHLKMGLIRSGICPLTPESPDEELTPYLWKIVKEIIKTAIENRQNLVIEGCYIPFDWKKDFEEVCLEQIRYVCLIFSEHYIQTHYQEIMDYADMIEKRMEGNLCSQEQLIMENRENLAKCRLYGCDYLFIDQEYQVEIVLT